MSSLNKVLLVGRIGRTPDIRSTTAGKEISEFSVATSSKSLDKVTGELKEDTEWHSIVVFDQRAVDLSKKIDKGDLVFVEGSIKTKQLNQENSLNGKPLTKIQIIVKSSDGLKLVQKKQSQQQPSNNIEPSDDLDNIPF
jgi:single stranded DNA-binding protein